MKDTQNTTYKIVVTALMAAMVFVLTMVISIPFLGSKLRFANAMCLLSGLLLGPLYGGLASGIGSGLYDLLNGYGIDEALITFISKGAIALVGALIAGRRFDRPHWRVIAGSVAGAWVYVALYMLKTFVYQTFVYSLAPDAVLGVMAAKLPASALNAAFAMIVAPLFYFAVVPALRRAQMLEKLR